MKKWLLILIFFIIGALVGILFYYLGPSPSPECPMIKEPSGEIGFYCTFWNYNFQFLIPSIIGAAVGGIIGALVGWIILLILTKIKK